MNNKLIILIVMISIIMITSLIVVFYSKEEATDMPEGVMYMTKEDVIGVFYNNFDTFDKVAEYIFNSPGTFYCDNTSNELLINNATSEGRITLDIENIKIGTQLKKLLYDMQFISILEDETGTRIDFGMPSDTGYQGLIYASEGLVESELYTPLDKEGWYYFFIVHSPPGGR